MECPSRDDLKHLTETLGVPANFINYVGDVDERPRVDREDDWTITILRIPARSVEQDDVNRSSAKTCSSAWRRSLGSAWQSVSKWRSIAFAMA